MAGKNIARILDKAYSTVGRVLGYDFVVYRPDNWIQPLQDRNRITTIQLSPTVDDGYSATPRDLDEFTLYANSSVLQRGDLVHNEELQQTYVVIDKFQLQPAKGVLAREKIDVLRPSQEIGSNFKRTFDQVGLQIPAAILTKGAGQSSGVLRATSSSMTVGQSDLDLRTWVPTGFIKLNDVIELNGNRYIVTFAQQTAQGTTLSLKSTKVGV